MEILKVENLSFAYPKDTKKAVDNVSFAVEKGSFITLCGATGSGKSTLLRLLKKEIAPLGEKEGEIIIGGINIEKLPEKQSAAGIGFVMQNPEQQIVTDKVWHELAFGLENMNLPPQIIRRRIAETSTFFGIEDLFDKNTSELSGGQKQLLNLASVMVMQPQILLLDEPTAQLDPVAAADYITTLKKINREFGITVIIAEHRLEELIAVSDMLMVMNKGRMEFFGLPKTVIKSVSKNSELLCTMPAAVKLYHELGAVGECPVSVREGRRFIEENFGNRVRKIIRKNYEPSKNAALTVKNVCFRYCKNGPDVLNGLDITVFENEIYCILGGNGSGKTTLLSAAANLIKPYCGEIKVFGIPLKNYKNQSLYNNCLALLPQDVQTVFIKNTVGEELACAENEASILPVDMTRFYNRHPYDLSGGEQQMAALAKVLAAKPRLLLMDEPTKGLDAAAVKGLVKVIKELKRQGITVVAVTHDTEFAAECADRCGLLFRGSIVSSGTPETFFAENNFYTTAANRMTRGYYDNVITVSDAVKLCTENGGKADGK